MNFKKEKKLVLGMGVLVLFSIAAIVIASDVWSGTPSVAIYAGPGSWADGVTALEHFLSWKGIAWKEVNAWDINNKGLAGYNAIIMPGGWAASYKKAISSKGEQAIKDLVSRGGAYIGFCAGAYYAADKVDWEGQTYDYPLKLFNGTAYGSLKTIKPWNGYTMTTLNMNLTDPINAYEPATEDMLYYGGPAFYPNTGQAMDTVASWAAYNNAPGIIKFNYGQGKVLLSGPHPEIEEDSNRDGTTFADELNDKGSDWPFLWSAMDWALGLPISSPPPAPVPAPDTTAPVINSIQDSPDPLNAGTQLLITADVTDNVAVDSVWVQIGVTNFTMAKNTGADLPTDLFFDGFESGSFSSLNWILSGTGKPWTVSSEKPYAGIYHAKAQQTGAGADSMLEKTLGTSGFSKIGVSYWRQLIGLDTADKFSAEWYDGTNYQNLELAKSVNDSGYVYKAFSLPSGASENPNFKLRFICENGAVSEECRLDDVKITGYKSGTNLWKYNFDTAGLTSGLHTYTVHARDTSKNETTRNGDFTIN